MRVCIEGNIGSGKTSLLTSLADLTSSPVVLEPVHEWAELLQKFYDDPGRWAFTFNLKVLTSFVRHQGGDDGGRLVLYERSPGSCRKVFTELQHMDGHMSDAELQVFDDVYGALSWEPDLRIYVRTSPVVCMDRIQRRARPQEMNIAPAYIKRVHDRHEAVFHDNCVIVDGNRSKEEVCADVMSIIERHTASARSNCC